MLLQTTAKGQTLRSAEPRGRRDPEHKEFERGDVQGSSVPGHLSHAEPAPYLVFLQKQLPLQWHSLSHTRHRAPDRGGAQILDLITPPCQNTHHLCRMGKTNLRVMHVFRGKQPQGRHREVAGEASWFGGGLDNVTSSSSTLLQSRWEDAGRHRLPWHG